MAQIFILLFDYVLQVNQQQGGLPVKQPGKGGMQNFLTKQ